MENTVYTQDNLFVLNGMEDESVDLIYLDPPFNSKRMYHAPTGSKAQGASFKDIWKWEDVDGHCVNNLMKDYAPALRFILNIGDMHSKPMMSYITYMAQRLIQMKRVLKTTGSIYLHCDQYASHYLKMVMDVIFGKKNFRNEIAWCYKSGGASKRYFSKKHDIILFYVKSQNYLFNPDKEKSYMGLDYNTGNKNISLYDDEDGLGKYTLVNVKDWWQIGMLATSAKERVGYPTQKPLALLDRIIKASSNKGDIILDPFCGCATAMVSAHHLGRKWVGIDVSNKAVELLQVRLETEQGLFQDFIATDKIPLRTQNVRLMKPKDAKDELYGKQNGFCRCGTHFEIRHLVIDHIIPKAKGGGDYFENYQLLCSSCNSIKGKRPLQFLDDYIERIQDAEKRIHH